MYRPKECPMCKSEEVKTIVYGLLDHPEALSGNEVPGGCVIMGGASPTWYCSKCKWNWGGPSCMSFYDD